MVLSGIRLFLPAQAIAGKDSSRTSQCLQQPQFPPKTAFWSDAFFVEVGLMPKSGQRQSSESVLKGFESEVLEAGTLENMLPV